MVTKEIELPSGKKTKLVLGNKQRMFAGVGIFVPGADEDDDTRTTTQTLKQQIEYAEALAELVCMCAPDLKLTTREPAPKGLKHYNTIDDRDWDALLKGVLGLQEEANAAARPTESAPAITTA